MTAVRIGLLGAARIAPSALIAPARVIPACSVVAIAARDQSRAAAFAEAHQIDHVFDDYDALIASPDIDLIYNPLMNHLHAEYCIKALEAGKDVLCEKPFAMNAREARRVLEIADQTGRRVIEAFHYRYHPAFETVLLMIREGIVGKVSRFDGWFTYHISPDVAPNRHQKETGGGAMMDLGCYPLHQALTIMDAAPETISAEAALTSSGVDEKMTAVLTFAGGVKARIMTSMAADADASSGFEVTGDLGVMRFDNAVAPYRNGNVTITKGDRITTLPISKITTYTYQLAAMIEALETGHALPTEGDDILRQQDVLDGVYRAAGVQPLRD